MIRAEPRPTWAVELLAQRARDVIQCVTPDRGCKAAPFKEPPLTAESGGATRAALLAMREHRGTGSSNPLPSSGESTNHRFLSGCLGAKACGLRSRTDSVGEVLYAVRDLGTGPQPGDLSDPLGNDAMLAAAGRRAAIMQRGLAAAAASLRGRNAGALST